MKTRIIFLILVFVLASFVGAQDPVPVLNKGDVQHFIKTYPTLKKDFEKFGASYEAKTGDITIPEALKVNKDFSGILKKHGWDESFFQKTSAILMGYSVLVYNINAREMDPQIARSIKEIESNPALSETMKKQMIQQMKMALGMLKNQGNLLKQGLNKADLDLIRPAIKELKKILETH